MRISSVWQNALPPTTQLFDWLSLGHHFTDESIYARDIDIDRIYCITNQSIFIVCVISIIN